MKLKVLTAQGVVLDKEVRSVVAPGAEGYLGILSNHAPLITPLRRGVLRWTAADDSKDGVQVDEGLLEVADNQVTALVSNAIPIYV